MQNQLAEMSVRPVSVRQIIATTSEWIHVSGSDESLYLVPTVPQTYYYEFAYCDAALLKALRILTSEAALLSWTGDLASKAGLRAVSESSPFLQHVIGWRLPKEGSGGRLLQVLPQGWLSRVTNREQFLEVLILDLWFRRTGQRQVIFKQTGQTIEAIFLPSGKLIGTQDCSIKQVEYRQLPVYNGLEWPKIEAGLKAKIASLTLSDLGHLLGKLPQIGVGHEVLKSLWFETVVNKVCFDQRLTDAMGPLFGGMVHRNHERSIEVPTDRLRTVSNASRGYSLGNRCS